MTANDGGRLRDGRRRVATAILACVTQVGELVCQKRVKPSELTIQTSPYIQLCDECRCEAAHRNRA
jgi:hypothetical protein